MGCFMVSGIFHAMKMTNFWESNENNVGHGDTVDIRAYELQCNSTVLDNCPRNSKFKCFVSN